MAELETSQKWATAVKRFLKNELNIKVHYIHYRDELCPDHIATFLFPYKDSRNMLSYNDIKRIREFFVKELGLIEGGEGLEKELENIRYEGVKNWLLVLIFEYVSPISLITTFIIEIPIIYAKIGNNEYFFLSSILIQNKEDDKESDEVLRDKAVRVLGGTSL
jgi:hypothetical protein